jgi:hypothetical protein
MLGVHRISLEEMLYLYTLWFIVWDVAFAYGYLEGCMTNINVVSLVSVVFLTLLVLVLMMVGIYNISQGIKALPRAEEQGQEPVWHKQLSILFGINNVVFAFLLLFGGGLFIVTERIVKYVLAGLVVFALIVSILLVVRTIKYSLLASQKLQQRYKNKS